MADMQANDPMTFLGTIEVNNSAEDISDATTLEVLFRDSDDTTVTKTAAFNVTGSDGVLSYTAASGEVSVLGTWLIQWKVTRNTGKTFHSEVSSFEVLKNNE